MKQVAFTIVVSLFATNAFSIEVPKRVQKKILAAAPEIDLNRDGEVTAEELISSREKLPENMRVMLDLYLGTQGVSPKESEPVKSPSEKGSDPLRDPGKSTNIESLPKGQTPFRIGSNPTTTLPKPPDSDGTTPFLDPIFEYQEIENITYCTAKSGDTTMPLLLDIYRPVASPQLPTKLPAMILAFGGGWRKGSKDVKYIRDLCGYYAQRGYVAISIQYRIEKDNPPALPGPAPNPEGNDQFRLINAAFQDTCDAVRWVRANADKYNIDAKRIGIGGVSAGAFNALHTGFCDDEITGPDAEVAAVISLMGALVASHIDEIDPPVFIAHGTRDNVAPYAMVKNMVQQLEKVDAEYSFYPVDGVAHRLETILEAEFDGKTVADHSLGFCFEAMKLGELIKESR